MPKALAFITGFALLFLWIASSKVTTQADAVRIAVGIAAPLVLCSILGVWQYRRSPRSLRAILRLFQMAGWPLAIGFSGPALAFGRITGTYDAYAAHWLAILVIFLSLVFALSFYYAAYRAIIRNQYAAFATYRTVGSIPADDLYDLLSFRGQSTRMTARLPLIVGVSVPVFSIVALVLNAMLHRDIRETVAFCLSLCLSAYFMAVLIARRWLQWKYLDGDDLTVVD